MTLDPTIFTKNYLLEINTQLPDISNSRKMSFISIYVSPLSVLPPFSTNILIALFET